VDALNGRLTAANTRTASIQRELDAARAALTTIHNDEKAEPHKWRRLIATASGLAGLTHAADEADTARVAHVQQGLTQYNGLFQQMHKTLQDLAQYTTTFAGEVSKPLLPLETASVHVQRRADGRWEAGAYAPHVVPVRTSAGKQGMPSFPQRPMVFLPSGVETKTAPDFSSSGAAGQAVPAGAWVLIGGHSTAPPMQAKSATKTSQTQASHSTGSNPPDGSLQAVETTSVLVLVRVRAARCSSPSSINVSLFCSPTFLSCSFVADLVQLDDPVGVPSQLHTSATGLVSWA